MSLRRSEVISLIRLPQQINLLRNDKMIHHEKIY